MIYQVNCISYLVALLSPYKNCIDSDYLHLLIDMFERDDSCQ